MIKACIFDLDGVLVNTAQYHYLAWNKLAQSLGFEVNKSQNEELKGLSRMDSLATVLEWGGLEKSTVEMKMLADKKNKWYRELIDDLSPRAILPGTKQFLIELNELDVPIAVGSASKNARNILDKLDLAKFFKIIVDGKDVKKPKPDPEVFLLGAKALNVKPKNVVVFEDSIKGIAAAKEGKMKVVGIGKKEILTDADYVIPSLAEASYKKLNSLLFEK